MLLPKGTTAIPLCNQTLHDSSMCVPVVLHPSLQCFFFFSVDTASFTAYTNQTINTLLLNNAMIWQTEQTNCCRILLNDIDTACDLLNASHQLVDYTHSSTHYTVHSNSYIATAADCLATAAKTSRRGVFMGCFRWHHFCSQMRFCNFV